MRSQKSQVSIARYRQSLRHGRMPSTIRWLLHCLLLIGLGYFLVRSEPLLASPAAQAETPPVVTQEIRYHMPEAGEVFLVWGIDGWQVVPEEIRPAGTGLKEALMYTPMNLEGEAFVAWVQAPIGKTIDYGFLITKRDNGAAVEPVWDGDYQTSATQDGLVMIKAAIVLPQDQKSLRIANASFVTQKIRYQLAGASEVFLVWGIDGWHMTPEEIQLAGTVVKNDVMRTPMVHENDTFVATVQLPVGAALDYGFLITKRGNGANIKAIWDGDWEQIIATEDSLVEVEASSSVVEQIATSNFEAEFLRLMLILGGLIFVLVVVAIRTRLISLPFVKDRPGEIPVNIDFSSKRVASTIIVIALLNVLFLGGTWFFTAAFRRMSGDWETSQLMKYVWIQFNLATENVVATWYSSMLLLLTAVVALLCFVADQQGEHSRRERYLSYGWLLVALIFAGLSFDELGSLHERLGELIILNPFGDYALGWVYVLALPIGLIALFMLAFGWVHLRRSPWSLALMVLGVGLFLSVPLQEYVEGKVLHLASDGQRPVWHLELEEGTEIFGTLALFSALVVYVTFAIRRRAKKAAVSQSRLTFNIELKTALISLIVFIYILILVMMTIELALPYMLLDNSGIPKNWFPSMLAGLSVIICFQLWDTTSGDERFRKFLYLACALFSLLLSIYYGANLYGSLYWGTLIPIGRVVHGILLIVAFSLGFLLARQVEVWWSRAGTIIWALLLGLAFGVGGTYTVRLAFAAFSLLLLSFMAHLQLQQPESTSLQDENTPQESWGHSLSEQTA